MEVLIGIFITFTFVVGVANFFSKAGIRKRKTVLSNQLDQMHEFIPFYRYFTPNYDMLISIDEELNAIVLVYGEAASIMAKNKDLEIKHYNYQDIVELKLIADENCIKNKSRIAPDEGINNDFLENSKNKIKKLELELIVDDLNSPVHKIIFYDATKKIRKTRADKEALEKIKEWYELIMILLNKAEQKGDNSGINKEAKLSIADELLKYSQLLKEGLLTGEEFNQQKNKLLQKNIG